MSSELSDSERISTFQQDIFELHLEEATFLWLQWSRALKDPVQTLETVARLEERLMAHLDGLVLGGLPVVESLLRPALGGQESARLWCAAFAYLAESGVEALEEMVALASVSAQQPTVRRVLELSEREGLDAALLPLVTHGVASQQALALEVLAFRRTVPRDLALKLLAHADARVVAAALRALGWLPDGTAQHVLTQLLADERPEVRLAAIEAGMLCRLPAAREACRREVQGHTVGKSVGARACMVLLAVEGEPRDVELLRESLEVRELAGAALWALGFSGRAAAAQAALRCIQEGVELRLAGEAFSSITGLDLTGAYLAPPPPPGEQPIPLSEEDLDADLMPRPEDGLPAPEPLAVTNWWQENHERFRPETRYLEGRPTSLETLLHVLEHGPMRRRYVLAHELCLSTQGAWRLEPYDFVRYQREQLARRAS